MSAPKKGKRRVADDFQLKAIATDMDGTFFSKNMKLLPSTLEAYRRAAESGLTIIPATGRDKNGVEAALKAAGAEDVSLYPGVYLNGATVYGSKGELIKEFTLSKSVIKKVLEFEKRVNEREMKDPDWQEDPFIKFAEPQHGIYPVLDKSLKPTFVTLRGYTAEKLICPEWNQLIDAMKQFNEGEDFVVGDFLEYSKQHPIYKVLIIGHSGEMMEPIKREIAELVKDEAEVVCSSARILEVVPIGVNKSSALLLLGEHLGVPLDTMACLGDGDNDIQMLRSSGYSILMGNASSSLKSMTSMVNEFTRTNTGDGWALAVNSLLDTLEEMEEPMLTVDEHEEEKENSLQNENVQELEAAKLPKGLSNNTVLAQKPTCHDGVKQSDVAFVATLNTKP